MLKDTLWRKNTKKKEKMQIFNTFFLSFFNYPLQDLLLQYDVNSRLYIVHINGAITVHVTLDIAAAASADGDVLGSNIRVCHACLGSIDTDLIDGGHGDIIATATLGIGNLDVIDEAGTRGLAAEGQLATAVADGRLGTFGTSGSRGNGLEASPPCVSLVLIESA